MPVSVSSIQQPLPEQVYRVLASRPKEAFTVEEIIRKLGGKRPPRMAKPRTFLSLLQAIPKARDNAHYYAHKLAVQQALNNLMSEGRAQSFHHLGKMRYAMVVELAAREVIEVPVSQIREGS